MRNAGERARAREKNKKHLLPGQSQSVGECQVRVFSFVLRCVCFFVLYCLGVKWNESASFGFLIGGMQLHEVRASDVTRWRRCVCYLPRLSPVRVFYFVSAVFSRLCVGWDREAKASVIGGKLMGAHRLWVVSPLVRISPEV